MPSLAGATPTGTGTVTISPPGTPTQGETLTAIPAGWTSTSTITYSYAWSDGATGPTDTLTAADVGKTISVTVTASDGILPNGTATSAPVGPVTGPPAISSGPTISGSPVQGSTLTATSTWAGYPPPAVSYVWSDGTNGPTDTLSNADVGRTVFVTAYASNLYGAAGPISSAAVGPVVQANTPPTNASPPTISGTAKQGNTLVASPGTWNGFPTPTFSYAWSDGTTGPTDTLSAADVGKNVSVKVTASNGVGLPVSVTSAALGPVAPQDAVATSTSLQAVPSSALTNESVLLIATVTSSSATHPPSGTITFKNGAAAVSGCANLPVAATGQGATITCRTSFGAAIASLTAVFAPTAGSLLTASASPVDNYAVGRDSTSTALDVTPTVKVGSSTTYTASVNPPAQRAGPILPSGSVEFLDNGQPITSCTNQPVSNGGATCTVNYRKIGNHRITAAYPGDGNFTGSTSAPAAVKVIAHAARRLTPTMQWTFFYSPTYTRVLALVINGANGDRVLVLCDGVGCPFSKLGTHVPKIQSCPAKTAGACQARMALTPAFHDRQLGVGARIRIWITRSGFIGKYYGFTIRARKPPKIRLSCVAPGATKPGAGC